MPNRKKIQSNTDILDQTFSLAPNSQKIKTQTPPWFVGFSKLKWNNHPSRYAEAFGFWSSKHTNQYYESGKSTFVEFRLFSLWNKPREMKGYSGIKGSRAMNCLIRIQQLFFVEGGNRVSTFYKVHASNTNFSTSLRSFLNLDESIIIIGLQTISYNKYQKILYKTQLMEHYNSIHVRISEECLIVWAIHRVIDNTLCRVIEKAHSHKSSRRL